MKTRKGKLFVKLAVLLCVLPIIPLCLYYGLGTHVAASAASSGMLMSTVVESYSADNAKYSQYITVNAPNAHFTGSTYYVDGLNIVVSLGKSDGSIGTNHRVWSLTYLRLWRYNSEGEWEQYTTDERIAAVCAHHGGGYNAVGTGLKNTSSNNLSTGGRSKTVSEYCDERGIVSDSSYIKDVTATRESGDMSTVKTFHIYDEGLYKAEIIVLGFQNGYGGVSAGARAHSATSSAFYVDRTAPEIAVDGANGGFANSSVNVRFADVYSGATAAYARNTDGSFPSTASTGFASGGAFYDEGNYLVVATDNVGWVSRATFTVDRTAPVLSLSGVANGGATNGGVTVSWDTSVGGVGAQRVNDNDALTVRYSYSGGYTPPDSAYTDISSSSGGITFNDNGSYRVTIWDSSGNSSSYTFVIDTVAPDITALPAEFINHSFSFSATDGYSFKGIEYCKDGGTVLSTGSATLNVSADAANFGVWQFRAYDTVGNYTGWYTTRLYHRTTFGNSYDIYNGYYLPAYYIVSLPSRTFGAASGRYTFADYSSAFDWAYKREWEFRVIELGNGNWSYVNIANESVHQVYTDRAELNTAVSKYASGYISERRVMGPTGGALSNPTDTAGVTRGDALTAQLASLPAHLSDYSNLTFMLAAYSYEFKRPAYGVSENTPSASIRMISDGITRQNGPEISIGYGYTLKAVLEGASAWRQGYYLVTERDRCGNAEQYVLCIDTGEPEVSAAVTLGNGTAATVKFTKAYAEQHYGTMRYLSLAFTEMFDSIDGFVMLNVNGRGMDNVKYVRGDELPVLCYENGFYGDYGITVYDRSLNAFEFSVRIAGIAPTVSYTSLTGETKCTLTITLNDTDNALSSVKLYKVAYDGEYTEKFYDDDGTRVGVQSLSYVLRTGGKYVLEFCDMYGREVVTEPIFYMKGLPVGTLSGVKAGGLTNRDVSFSYDATCSVNLYAWQNGVWTAVDGLMQITDGESRCKADITAGADTSFKFKFFLYVTDDMNLFTEYFFELDCIPPQIDICTVNGGTVAPETVTPDSFYLNWSESGYTAYYYNKNSSLGSLAQERYMKETVISRAGTYVFEVYDSAKNLSEFTVTLDNAVSWTLDSPAYSRLDDGSYITKHNFTLTVNERTSVWEVTSTNSFTPVNGQKIDLDGTYTFHIEDVYQNAFDIVLIVDNLPPEAIITAGDGTALYAGCRTNKPFTVSCAEENVAITYSFANSPFSAYDGSTLDSEGVYNFKLVDRMGNAAEVTLVIDRGVNYSVRGSYVMRGNDYYSRTWLSFTVDEGYALFTITDGNGFALNVSDRLETEGAYTVRIEDAAGNTSVFRAVIDKTAPTAQIRTLGGDEVAYGGTVNGSFLVFCDEADSVITYAKGSGSYAAYDGGYISGFGVYGFNVSDFLGNSATFTVRVDSDVDFVIGGTYVLDIDGNYISKSWLSVTMREEYLSFRIVSEDGAAEYSDGERVSAEGVYSVEITDMTFNTVRFGLVIDRTAPGIKLVGAENGGKTRGDVGIEISDYAEAYYRVDGSPDTYKLEEGFVFAGEGAYTVSAKDVAGNEAVVSFTIDKSVEVTPSRELAFGQLITGDVSFTFGETVTAELLKDGVPNAYTRGKISGAGEYMLTVTDALGNAEVFSWTVLDGKTRGYEFDIPEGFTVSILSGGNVITSAVDSGKVKLTENGAYTLYFDDGVGAGYGLELTVDNLAPSVQITRNKKYVAVSDPSKEGLTYKLYKDGKEVGFKLGKDITDVGDYRLEISDDVGNTAVYNFGLHYVNTAGVLLISAACVLVVLFIVILVVIRIRQRIR